MQARVRTWNGVQSLPYFLKDAFDIHELQLGNKIVLLASTLRQRLRLLRTLRTQMDKLAQ
jgi:hypothetical protein